MLQRVDRMRVTRLLQHRACRIIRRQRGRDVAHAPGAAQIQAVEMAQLRIRAIADDRDPEKVLRLALGDAGQKCAEPLRKPVRGQHTMHEIGFGERGREEVGSARLELRGVVCVLAEIVGAASDQQFLQLRVVHRVRVIECECETEGRVRMKAGANRVNLLREEIKVARRKRVGQRFEVRRPCFRLQR